MKKIKNILEFILAKAITFFIQITPHSTALTFGRCLGRLFFYFVPIRKKVMSENLTRAFPELGVQDLSGLMKRCYLNFAQSIIEFVRLPRASRDFFKRHVTFINPQLFEEAIRQGKGAVLLSGHFGNWEMMAAAIRALGYPMKVIAREQRNGLIDQWINANRHALGIETIQLGMAIRGVLKALHENSFVAMLGDQDAHDEGIFVDFLGRLSSTAPGPAVFALKTRAPIIFGSAVRGPDGHHTMYLEKIDHSDLSGFTEQNIRILTQRHTAALEASIRRWPDHWFWMHKRWKTQPKT